MVFIFKLSAFKYYSGQRHGSATSIKKSITVAPDTVLCGQRHGPLALTTLILFLNKYTHTTTSTTTN